jgi:two-component system NtrC family sensor kinase
MMTTGNPRDRIDFVVGEERNLSQVISGAEVTPLLAASVRSGASKALIKDGEGQTLWSQGESELSDPLRFELPLTLEGEAVGTVELMGSREREKSLQGLAGLLTVAAQTLVTNNLKRMLTTEIHTTVVNHSYDELLETNRKLSSSEGRYRELAESLERKVEERTTELKRMHTKLLQQEKLAAVGQLAAGMAHEINNPLGFISSNLNTLKKYTANLMEMLELYRQTLSGAGIDGQMREQLTQHSKRLKLELILSDIDSLISQSSAGCARVGKIIADLKGFSHIDEGLEMIVDLNLEIDRTLSVLGHQLPTDARIEKRYGKLTGFACNAARICQVFFNIILNALQAKTSGLCLTIETREDDGHIVLLFSDNGPGIPPGVTSRIFEPFFTTKEVGAGMGMGLAEAYDVISSYGGTIEAQSRSGQGTTLRITLPATHKALPAEGA